MEFIKRLFGRATPDPAPDAPPVRVLSLADLDAELLNSTTEVDNVRSTMLSAQELYLLQQVGLEPVQVVFGTIVYSMGVQGVLRSVKRVFMRGEMPDFTHFNQTARKVALLRMRAEAEAINAVGVVAVRIDVKEMADFIEVVAFGCAVKQATARGMSPMVSRPSPSVVVSA